MKFSVDIAPSAFQDMDKRINFVAQKSPEHADFLAQEFYRAIDNLSFLPNRHKCGSILGTRESIFVKNYVIVFKVDNQRKHVDILHVWHQAQDR